MDSVNLLPLLTQEKGAKGLAVLVHYSQTGKAALRQGDWKLHVYGKNLKKLKAKQLFKLKTNPAEDETKDLLNNPEYSERAQRMMDTLKQCI